MAPFLHGANASPLMTLPPLSVDKILTLVTALACVVMLVRMALRPAARQRLDATAWRVWFRVRSAALFLWQWRRRRQARDQARRTAQAVIERARQSGSKGNVQRDGNVLTPDSFQRPRKPH